MKIAVSAGDKEKAKGQDSPYFKALVAAGARPEEVQMVSAADAGFVSGEEFDGLLLTGGADVDPELYGEEKKFDNVRIDRKRDNFELVLLENVMKLRLPVLGICRGVQVINVKFGGTLYQDLKSERPLGPDHKQAEGRGEPTHGVTVTDPDSRLHQFIGSHCRVNSLHHQALKRLGRGLKITAHAEDGLIEAVELTEDYPFFLGVQWHPEEMDRPEQRKILEEFVTRCRESERQGSAGSAGV